ncbi:MAG TPA: ABC transporter permease [Burkholderiales bacterium]
MIELRDVHKTYRMGAADVHALRGITLSIAQGEFVAITGPSGSGKSTLMHVIGLLDVPDSGSYELNGREVGQPSENELAQYRRREIGFVFQQFHLLARASAAENVCLPLLYSRGRHDLEAARALLAQVGLADREEHHPNELSGGQQQRVAIARALINRPAILLADEPTGNLDSASQREILAILEDLNQQGMIVVIVTHEDDVARHAHRRIEMRDGKIERDSGRSAVSAAAARVAPAAPEARSRLRELLQHLRSGLRALATNKVRTALSVLGVLIGVAAVVAMLALGRGAQDAVERQLSSLGSNLLVLRTGAIRVGGVAQEAGTTTRLEVDDVAAIIERVPDVRQAGPAVWGRVHATYGNKNWNTQVTGAGVAYARMRAAEPTIGRFFTGAEDRNRVRVALVGLTLVRELFGGENPVGQSIKLNRINFTVIGVLPEKGSNSWRDQDDLVVVPVQTAMYRLLGKTYLDYIDIEATSAQAIEQVERAVRDLMVARHRIPPVYREDAFRVRNLADIRAAYEESSRTMSVLLASIAAISLLVGGIGIMNIMLVSVTERTREIGLRKAIGARPRDILNQFLVETVVVSVVGGLSGVALGWAVTVVLSHIADWSTTVTIGSVLLAFSFSAIIGIVFGIYPARRASTLNPIEALRYE